MLKFLSLLAAVCFCSFVYAQTDTLNFSKEEMRLLDSMFKSDEFINLMMKKKESYFEILAGGGNQLLSTNNNNANAGELKSSFALTPAISYNHKSGLGLSVSSFLASDSGQFKPYQYAINPYFSFYNKAISLGLYYTRYIFNTSSHFSPNPYQNAFYGNFSYTKTFIEPGIAASYNNGKFTDTFRVLNITRNFTVKLSDFSVSPYIMHDFYFYELFSKNDGLSFTPSLILLAGRQQVKAPGLNNTRLALHPRLKNYLKNRFETDSKFQLQSVAASIALKYLYKSFFIQPGIYLDYYLPATSYKRFTTVFSIGAGFDFY